MSQNFLDSTIKSLEGKAVAKEWRTAEPTNPLQRNNQGWESCQPIWKTEPEGTPDQLGCKDESRQWGTAKANGISQYALAPRSPQQELGTAKILQNLHAEGPVRPVGTYLISAQLKSREKMLIAGKEKVRGELGFFYWVLFSLRRSCLSPEM